MSQVTDSPAGMCPADIGRVRQLGDPRVSPDGSAVAFTVTDPDPEGNRYAHRIWLVGARGTGARPQPDDLRCPISQAEELFVALRLLGRNPVMYRFPGENHELTRSGAPQHRVSRAELILAWFRQHLYS